MASYQIGTENQASSCPCQSRLLWLPLNPMECGGILWIQRFLLWVSIQSGGVEDTQSPATRCQISRIRKMDSSQSATRDTVRLLPTALVPNCRSGRNVTKPIRRNNSFSQRPDRYGISTGVK